jgi:glycosyltransferase involved in cell wall biosynthesis
MLREPAGHEYTLVVDAVTAAEGGLPQGTRLEVVRTREQPTRAAGAESARSPLDLWRLSRAASGVAADVFFFPAVYSFYPLLRRVPTVVTFHDAIAENHPRLIFPGLRSRVFWGLKSRLAMRQADRILTVSESARARIAAAFGRAKSEIAVIAEGPSEIFRFLEDRAPVRGVLERYGLPHRTPLVLYVGGISPHKNLQGLIAAFARVVGDVPCHLALVGDTTGDSFLGCHRELMDERRRLGLEGAVTFTGFVPNDDLVALYNAATLLVLPSFEEGFGLPAVEAMACGLPVAASRRGSLPEVLGSAGVFFEPEDTPGMASAIRGLLEDRGRRDDLRAAGLERVTRFSWRAAARATIRLLEDVAGRPPRPGE